MIQKSVKCLKWSKVPKVEDFNYFYKADEAGRLRPVWGGTKTAERDTLNLAQAVHQSFILKTQG